MKPCIENATLLDFVNFVRSCLTKQNSLSLYALEFFSVYFSIFKASFTVKVYIQRNGGVRNIFIGHFKELVIIVITNKTVEKIAAFRKGFYLCLSKENHFLEFLYILKEVEIGMKILIKSGYNIF